MKKLVFDIDFIENYLLKANPIYSMVYICACTYIAQSKEIPSSSFIAKQLGLRMSDVNEAITFWTNEGKDIFIKTNSKPAPEISDKTLYKSTEISGFMSNDKSLKVLFFEVQKALNKILSSTDEQVLFWIYDYLQLPTPVILLIVNYAINQDKPKLRFIEQIAIEWADNGIDTLSKAEKHLEKLENSNRYENKIRKLFGIHDRKLTPGEKTIVNQWFDELKPTDEELTEAMEISVDRTSKISLKYINGIIKKWRSGVTNDNMENPISKNKSGTKFSQFNQRDTKLYDDMDIEAVSRLAAENK